MKCKRKNKNTQKKMRKLKSDFQKYKILKNDSVEMKQISRKSAIRPFKIQKQQNVKQCPLNSKKKKKHDAQRWN